MSYLDVCEIVEHFVTAMDRDDDTQHVVIKVQDAITFMVNEGLQGQNLSLEFFDGAPTRTPRPFTLH